MGSSKTDTADRKAELFLRLVQELQKRYDHDTARPHGFGDARDDLSERIEYIDMSYADGDRALTVLENIGETIASGFRMADVFADEVSELELEGLVHELAEENRA